MKTIAGTVLPSCWQKATLSMVASIRSGSTPSRSQYQRYFEDGDIPWIKTMDLNNGPIRKTDERITQLALKESSCELLPPKTVLLAMYGGFNQIGRTGLATFHATTNQAISGLVVKPSKAVPEYVLHWLNENVMLWRRFAASSRKDPNITKSDVANFPILLPPLCEQRKIAQILTTWDDAITTTEQLIDALERRKKGLMQRLLTGRTRLPSYKNSDWQEVSLGNVFQERKERGFSDLPLLSITNDQGIIYRDELERRDTSNSDKSRYLRICENDIGYNTMRMWQGVSALSPYEGIVSPAYTVCIPDNSVSPAFMAYLFQLPEMINKFHRYSQGLVRDTLNLKFSHFAKIRAYIPATKKEQEQIVAILDTASSQIQSYNEYKALLNEQKKGLMQSLLTGQVRVQPDEVPTEMAI